MDLEKTQFQFDSHVFEQAKWIIKSQRSINIMFNTSLMRKFWKASNDIARSDSIAESYSYGYTISTWHMFIEGCIEILNLPVYQQSSKAKYIILAITTMLH